MLKVLWGKEAARQSSLMEDVWRFRHQQFVERLGWNDIRRPDGREIDRKRENPCTFSLRRC